MKRHKWAPVPSGCNDDVTLIYHILILTNEDFEDIPDEDEDTYIFYRLVKKAQELAKSKLRVVDFVMEEKEYELHLVFGCLPDYY